MSIQYPINNNPNYAKGKDKMSAVVNQTEKSKSISLGYVRIAEMMRLPQGNRDVKDANLSALKRKWNDAHVGVFVLSLRADGAYYILDGQHRHELMLRAGRGRDQFPAEIHLGLTPDEELKLCRDINVTRKQWTAADKFKMDLAIQSPDAIEITRIVEKHGLSINLTDGDRSNGRIAGIGALTRIYTSYQGGALDEVLGALVAAFGTNSGFASILMKGVAEFVATYRDHPNYSRAGLVRALSYTTATRLEAEGAQARDMLGLGSTEGVAYQVLRGFNHKKRSTRLPDWGTLPRRGAAK